MINFFKQKIKSFFNLLYPNLCLHCSAKLKNNFFYFCEDCLGSISYITPTEEPYCAVFDRNPFALSIIKELRRQKILSMPKIAASFIVIQLAKISWPIPDKIIPITNKTIFKDHRYYLAKEVKKFFPKKILKNENNNILVVTDVLSLHELEVIKKKYKNQNIYAIGLCFDFLEDSKLWEN
ncbi:MAG: hypothetical protein WCT85_01430 [Parachlamydiales bacterium]|jgi:hypothetical protein